MRHFCRILMGGVLLSACGGDGGGTGPTAGSIAVSAGNNQIGAAGTALAESLAVIVRDQQGNPLPGAIVTFSVTAGGGTVFPATVATDAAGIAKTRRTLGPNAGTQTANAVTGSLAPVPFSAVSQINGAVEIANATGATPTDTVGATETDSLSVLVTDQNDTPVPGITVQWASAVGTVSPTSRVTSAAGLAKTQFTYGTGAGNQTATATVTGLVGSPVTITLTATAGTAVSIAKTAGDNVTAPPSTNVTYTVQSRDSHGNPKSGVTIDWAVASGGGSITPAQNITVNGNASATRTLGAGTGAQTATAIAAGLSTPDTVTFTTTAAIVTTIEVGPGNSFNPNALTVSQGTVVTFSWQNTAVQHNVTFSTQGSPANISDRTTGDVNRTFSTLGTFNYSCTNHVGMNGSVTVN